MTGQLDLFEGVKLAVPEPTTTVRLGRKTIQIPLRKKRREATNRLMEILEELEGKDVYIGSYDAGGRHFWLDNLKLPRLQLEWHPIRLKSDQTYIPSVVVLACPPKRSPVLMLDWKIRKGAIDGQEILHTGADYQQAARS